MDSKGDAFGGVEGQSSSPCFLHPIAPTLAPFRRAPHINEVIRETARMDFDLFVIGGGSAGVRCARISAGHGARVGIAEERFWGGTCVNIGCVPK